MTYLKSLFRHTIDSHNDMKAQDNLHWQFADYGELNVAKYAAMRTGKTAKKTWFFAIEITTAVKRQRYVFLYGNANERMRQRTQIALMIIKDPAE